MEKLPWKSLIRAAMAEAPDRGVRLKVLQRRCLEAAEERLASSGPVKVDKSAVKKLVLKELRACAEFNFDEAKQRVVWAPGKNPGESDEPRRSAQAGGGAAAGPSGAPKEKKQSKGGRQLEMLARAAAAADEAEKGAMAKSGSGGGKAKGGESEEEKEEEGDEDGGDAEPTRQRGRGYSESWNKAPLAQRFGKFSEEEKNAIVEAVRVYAEEHDLSRDDLSWLVATKKGTDGGGAGASRGSKAWLEIAAAAPHRSPKQVFAWGARHFHPDSRKGRWSEEEDEQLKKLVAEKGRQWTEIGKEIGRMPLTCADRYKLIKEDFKKGKWTDEEVERLKAIVEEVQQNNRQSGGRSDNIGAMLANRELLPWTAIAERLGGRSSLQCLEKWYKIAPKMTQSGLWDAADDKVLLQALFDSGATAEVEVKWDTLVPGRDKATCIRRWKIMAKKVPDADSLGFSGAVEYLAERFLNKAGGGGGGGDDGGGGGGGEQQAKEGSKEGGKEKKRKEREEEGEQQAAAKKKKKKKHSSNE